MRISKTALSLLVCIALIFSLAACSGSAIYYRAENPHSELIIKLEDGKETVINTPSALNTTLINCTDSIKSNVLAINDDGLWCAANDEQYSYDEKGSRITSTNYYLLCIDSDGDIKNAVGMEKTEIIAIDGDTFTASAATATAATESSK